MLLDDDDAMVALDTVDEETINTEDDDTNCEEQELSADEVSSNIEEEVIAWDELDASTTATNPDELLCPFIMDS